ncbi:metal-dependent phosphohydrolase, partial [Streptomyces sp. NPDC057067]
PAAGRGAPRRPPPAPPARRPRPPRPPPGAVVRQTGVDPAVAVVVEQQADPYREQQTAARIVRTVNAYDDLCGEGVKGSLGALEQLRLGTGRDYQPQVVEALARVLARGGLTPAGAG